MSTSTKVIADLTADEIAEIRAYGMNEIGRFLDEPFLFAELDHTTTEFISSIRDSCVHLMQEGTTPEYRRRVLTMMAVKVHRRLEFESHLAATENAAKEG